MASNVTVYVVDSGIRITHDEFTANRASYGRNVVDGTMVSDDGFGHGTHVAATIGGATYGVAKDVKLVAVRVFDDNGEGDVSEVVEGLDWVVNDVAANHPGPAVINMSLGSDRSQQVNAAVKAATDAGITVVVSAGNRGDDACKRSPASAPEAITVGATDQTDTMASFSNSGSCVDVFAPGVGVVSALNTSDQASGAKSGTSMATPHVAGAAALHLAAHPAATPAEVQHDLVAAATSGKVTGLRSCTTGRLLTVGLPAASPVGDDVPPAATGDLTAPESATPGATIAVSGTGFDPGGTVTYTAYPGATALGTATASGTGAVSGTVTVPAGAACDVTVVARDTTHVLSARVDVAVQAAPIVTAPAPVVTLPLTGADAGGIAATGTAMVLLGVAAVLVAGRRREVTLHPSGRHRARA